VPLQHERTAGTGTRENFESVIRTEEGKTRSHVDQVVGATVEQTLNHLLHAEADAIAAS
jgi:hypothetical protein